jgi:hypothetical protein
MQAVAKTSTGNCEKQLPERPPHARRASILDLNVSGQPDTPRKRGDYDGHLSPVSSAEDARTRTTRTPTTDAQQRNQQLRRLR